MKAKLAFELPEEQEEFKMATTASEAYGVLVALDTWLRAKVKWEEHPPEGQQVFEECRDKLQELLGEYGIVIF
jgi:hypothetical protein